MLTARKWLLYFRQPEDGRHADSLAYKAKQECFQSRDRFVIWFCLAFFLCCLFLKRLGSTKKISEQIVTIIIIFITSSMLNLNWKVD